MPGFDGTGPRGEGPMTGGARGHCNPAARNLRGQGPACYGVGRGGAPWGGGMGRAWGGGRGWRAAGSVSEEGPISVARERQVIAEQLSNLECELKELKARLGELEVGPK